MQQQDLDGNNPSDTDAPVPQMPTQPFDSDVEPVAPLLLEASVAEEELRTQPCLTYMLVGKTGHGKSSTGNTLSNCAHFQTSDDFESVTPDVNQAYYTVESQEYCCIDTPGICDTKLSLNELCARLAGVTQAAPNGLDAVVFIVRKGRMTEEELQVLEILQTLLGSDVWHHVVLVFTHCTSSLKDIKKRICSLPEEHLLKGACIACDWRIAKIDNCNPEEEDREFVHALIQDVRRQTCTKFENIAFERAREVLTDVNKDLKDEWAAFTHERCQLKACLNSGKISLTDYTEQLHCLKIREEEFAKKKQKIELDSLQKSFERWDLVKDWSMRAGSVAVVGAATAGSVGVIGCAARYAFGWTLPLVPVALAWGNGNRPESMGRIGAIAVNVNRVRGTMNEGCTLM